MERDQFLTEAMGECWHRGDQMTNHGQVGTDGCLSTRYICDCGEVFNQPYNGGDINPVDFIRSFWRSGIDFSTWEGFGKLWEWAQEQGWWGAFVMYGIGSPGNGTIYVRSYIVNPDKFANAVYEFLKERT